jgi:hypothetical protein
MPTAIDPNQPMVTLINTFTVAPEHQEDWSGSWPRPCCTIPRPGST